MRRGYLKTVGLAGFVSVVANTTLLANVHYFLTTFLGKGTDKWVPAIGALEILCFYGILRSITEPIGSCIMALGHTKHPVACHHSGGNRRGIIALFSLGARGGLNP